MTAPHQSESRLLRIVLLAVAGLTALAVIPEAHAQTYSILYSFQGSLDGANPQGVVLDAEGNLYGTTSRDGGLYAQGTLYKLNPRNVEAILFRFLGDHGEVPYGTLLMNEKDSALFGTTIYGGTYKLGTVFGLDRNRGEVVLHNFSGTAGDGENPEAGLVRDEAGNFYGTALYGGLEDCGNGLGCGMVFELSPTGEETQLHLFTGGTDGGWPMANLVRDKAGNLYGTANGGGDLSCYSGYGCGTVFKIDAAGNFSVLYAFHGGARDGAGPEASVILDEAGSLYGTTIFGGSGDFGTVFKVDPAGKETVLHVFLGQPEDGQFPAYSPLLRDAAGNLYGEATGGGNTCDYGPSGCGIMFKLSPAGDETVLHYFTGMNGDGAYPSGGLVSDGKGNLYGTTGYGGPYSYVCIQYDIEYGCGTVFRLTE